MPDVSPPRCRRFDITGFHVIRSTMPPSTPFFLLHYATIARSMWQVVVGGGQAGRRVIEMPRHIYITPPACRRYAITFIYYFEYVITLN